MNGFSSSPDPISRISELSSSAWAYAGLSAAFELGVVRALDGPAPAEEIAAKLDLEPELVTDLLEVLVALGAAEQHGDGYGIAPEFEAFRSGSLARVMRAGVRSDHLQTAEAHRRARDGSLASGWSHRDPDLLVAQGETAGLFRLAAEHVLPSLPGLRERLERPGARFLDVGAGVGVLSTELCTVYPEVMASCVEPNPTARAIGRERCREAGLERRVEFLGAGVEELELEPDYDLALIPQPFLSPDAFATGLRRVREALAPGGWLVVLTLDVPGDDPLAAASRRVRARLWGGGALQEPEAIDMLGRCGFQRAHAHPPVGAYRMFAAQRSELPAAAGRTASEGRRRTA